MYPKIVVICNNLKQHSIKSSYSSDGNHNSKVHSNCLPKSLPKGPGIYSFRAKCLNQNKTLRQALTGV